MEMKEDVVIIGAGIAGLATALALKRVGVRSLILEKAHELRTTGAALSLFPNAWLALDALGVSEKLNAVYTPYKRSFITDVATGVVQEVSFTGSDGTKFGPRGVHRTILLNALAEELAPDTIRFSTKISSIETERLNNGSSITVLHLDDGTMINAKVLIGCDGVHSIVARRLGLNAPVDSGRGAVRGLALFPDGHGLGHVVQQFLHKGRRVGFCPLNDTELYWFYTHGTATKENDDMMSGDPKLIQKSVLESSTDIPAVFLDVVRHSELSTLSWAPLMFRVPWNLLFGKLNDGNVTVAGDAMHPMTPDLGQGGGAALEDAVVLGRLIGNSFHQHNEILSCEVTKAIDLYVNERKWRAAALILGAYLIGRVQSGGARWYTKYLRNTVFYKVLFIRLTDFFRYDCGTLPQSSALVTNKID